VSHVQGSVPAAYNAKAKGGIKLAKAWKIVSRISPDAGAHNLRKAPHIVHLPLVLWTENHDPG
jgi:hypothetical protein